MTELNWHSSRRKSGTLWGRPPRGPTASHAVEEGLLWHTSSKRGKTYKGLYNVTPLPSFVLFCCCFVKCECVSTLKEWVGAGETERTEEASVDYSPGWQELMKYGAQRERRQQKRRHRQASVFSVWGKLWIKQRKPQFRRPLVFLESKRGRDYLATARGKWVLSESLSESSLVCFLLSSLSQV